ncbi:hypothetical protein ACQP0C_42000 (plasmid) [Nocardia sp. CA-129566]|uniref:hypothetical protein n=1 Tax=Nocardia sp. CA-129566 TaxID=3239976 RepID=UPI003D997D8D
MGRPLDNPEAQQSDSPGCQAAVYTIELPLRRPPLTSNGQRRAHWSTVRKAKAEVASMVGWQARSQLPKRLRLNRTRVTVCWHAPDARRRDSDSLGPFLKAALDALTEAGVLPDDDAAHVLETRQRIVIDRVNPRITIELEDLDAAPEIRPSVPVAAPQSAGKASAERAVRSLREPSSAPRTDAPAMAPNPAAAAPRVSLHLVPAAHQVSSPAVSQPSSSVLRDTSRCVVCDVPITQPGTGRPRKTCSGACRVRAHRRAKK